MADPLLELILGKSTDTSHKTDSSTVQSSNKYLSRLLSLRSIDLTTTEPESLKQSLQSTSLQTQALSSRSQRSITVSSDHLSNLQAHLPTLVSTSTNLKSTLPSLDDATSAFATTYSRTLDTDSAISSRKQSMLLSRQSEELQDILDLPSLLRTAITTATSGSTNYNQALDLLAHLNRLRVLYPDSQLILTVQSQANAAMKDMTQSLLTSLRAQTIRLPAAIRTIGWLKRVVPDLTGSTYLNTSSTEEGSLGAVFLTARLATFINMTDALSPLRDLADQETERRGKSSSVAGQQTERYLKRYIEIFREQAFATVQMFKNVFPARLEDQELPSAIAGFPFHLVSLLVEQLEMYLPNVVDASARESLLIQVLYAANSLGRLGADFSMMISLLDLPETDGEPEWYRVIKKHKVQAARLEALASGQENRRASDVVVKS